MFARLRRGGRRATLPAVRAGAAGCWSPSGSESVTHGLIDNFEWKPHDPIPHPDVVALVLPRQGRA